jgi:hypothetical protein
MTTGETAAVAKHDLERLSLQVQALALDLKEQSVSAKKDESPKPWWETGIQFLGLPVVILGLILTFSQIRSEQAAPALTSAEARKAEADASKATAETAKLNFELAELQRAQAQGRRVELEEIDKLIPRLRTELNQSMQQQERQRLGVPLILKFVVFSIAWMSIGLLTTPFGLVWGGMLNLVSQLIWRGREKIEDREKEGETYEQYRMRYDQHRARWRRIERTWHISTLFLSPMSTVLDWSLRILLFAAVAVPLFDQTAQFFGVATHFSQVTERLLSLDVSGAIARVRDFIVA